MTEHKANNHEEPQPIEVRSYVTLSLYWATVIRELAAQSESLPDYPDQSLTRFAIQAYGDEIELNLLTPEGVFKPQVGSEQLLKAVIVECAQLNQLGHAPLLMWDIGTGTGIQGIAATKLGYATVMSDISGEAIEAARRNAKKNGIRSHVSFKEGDLTEPVDNNGVKQFTLVVANLPTLPTNGPHFPGVTAGPDGRDLLNRLLPRVGEYLVPGGSFLTVHSHFVGIQETLDVLKNQGLEVDVVSRRVVPMGTFSSEMIPYMDTFEDEARRPLFHVFPDSPSGEPVPAQEVVVIRAKKPMK